MNSRHRLRPDDAGITLMELLVSLSVMSVLGSLFTAGILQMYRTTNWVEARSTSQSQIHTMFMRLDKEIRYATAIAVPVQLTSGWYVEYAFLDTHTDPAVHKCTQIWLDSAARMLRSRTWVEGAAPSDFVVLASDVTSTQPFTLPSTPADGVVGIQRLRLSLEAVGTSSSSSARRFNVTFTALNTSETSDADTCAAERPIA